MSRAPDPKIIYRKADMRNHAAKNRFKEIMDQIEAVRKYSNKVINDEIFDQKRAAYKYHKEYVDYKLKRSNDNLRLRKVRNYSRFKVMMKMDGIIQKKLRESPEVEQEISEDNDEENETLKPTLGNLICFPSIYESQIKTKTKTKPKKEVDILKVELPKIEDNSNEAEDEVEIVKDDIECRPFSTRSDSDVKKNVKDVKRMRHSVNLPPITMYKNIILSDYWVGDPRAIRSVRRPQNNPKEVSNCSECIGKTMHLIRDMPLYPACSRNCARTRRSDSLAAHTQENGFIPEIVRKKMNKEIKRSLNLNSNTEEANIKEEVFQEENKPINEAVEEVIEGENMTKKENKNKEIRPTDVEVLETQVKGSKFKSTVKVVRSVLNALSSMEGESAFERDETVTSDANNTTRVIIGYKYKPLPRLSETQNTTKKIK